MSVELMVVRCAGLFAGASIDASIVERPARRAPGTGFALAQWRPSYERGSVRTLLSLAPLGTLRVHIAGYI
jgi:hypothetical protein